MDKQLLHQVRKELDVQRKAEDEHALKVKLLKTQRDTMFLEAKKAKIQSFLDLRDKELKEVFTLKQEHQKLEENIKTKRFNERKEA